MNEARRQSQQITEEADLFAGWLARYVGTCKWVVARKSKKRIEQGYELFLTQKRFTSLKRHFEKETGEMDRDQVSMHLTEPDLAFAQRRKETFPGMAFWSGTGPDNQTCRNCALWQFDGYMAGSGLLKDSICTKYKSLMCGAAGPRIPHYAKTCKYFTETTEPRSLEKPRVAT